MDWRNRSPVYGAIFRTLWQKRTIRHRRKTMTTRTLKLKCYHPDCANDRQLEIKVTVPRWGRATSETKETMHQCERGHFNVIPIPANWGVREPILGDDGIIGNDGGIL